MRLTVGLAQIYPKLGDVQANLARHLEWIAQAGAQGADLVVFPELSLTGYCVQDMVPEVAIRAARDDEVFRALLDASAGGPDLVIGFVHADARRRFYIASAYLSRGQCLHIHHKVYLPTYGMFDDERYFDQGSALRAFDTRFGRAGMLICEDFWHMSAPYVLWQDGADLLIFTSCSPSRGVSASEGGRLTVSRWVELMTQAYASAFTCYVVHVNRVGYEDGRNYWGGSSITNPDGEFLTRGRYFDEALIVQEIDLNQIHRTRSQLPLLRDERPHLVQRELARILNGQGA
ncbi:MAG: nitrilase-related carbon-nitrogen hydrolase [Aggregatilineales bacterium]